MGGLPGVGPTSAFWLPQNLCWISDDNFTIGYVFQNDCTHSYDGTLANAERAVMSSLLDHRSSADIDEVVDLDPTVAAHTRRERDIVTDSTIVGHIGVDVALEVFADGCVAGDHRERTENRPFPHLHIVVRDMRRIGDREEPKAFCFTALDQLLPSGRIRYRHGDPSITIFLSAEFLKADDGKAVDLRTYLRRIVINNSDVDRLIALTGQHHHASK